MSLLAWGVVLAGGILLVPYLVGALLRRESVSRLCVLLPVGQERVWQELEEPGRHPVSGTVARAIEALPGQPGGGWIEDLGNARIEVRTLEREVPRRRVLQIRDLSVPMTARWTLDLEPDPEGTRVRLENRTAVLSGSWLSPVYRFVLRFSGATDKVLREYVRSIAGSLNVTARVLPPEG